MKKNGRYTEPNHEKDHQDIVNEINKNSPMPISVNVAIALTEYSVSHGFDTVPTCFFQVVCGATTGKTVLYPTATPWDKKKIYITSAGTGLFHIIIRK
jgi:hypothetical protein